MTSRTITINDPLRINLPNGFSSGSDIAVAWTGTAQATMYVLERKIDANEYTEVYRGALRTFNDTAGNWTSVQYRVKFSVGENDSPWYESDILVPYSISKQRLHRLNSEGKYDTIYPETSTSAVLMSDGKTVDEALSENNTLDCISLIEYNKAGDAT